jgi:hypothetical protein
MSFEFLQHFWHSQEDGNPLMELPGFIDSHADEKDDELAFHLGRHPGINYLRHEISSRPQLVMWDAASRACTIAVSAPDLMFCAASNPANTAQSTAAIGMNPSALLT